MAEPSRHLNEASIVETVERLRRRVAERFPEAGLTSVAGDLLAVARQARDRAREIRRPILWLRAFVGLLVAAIVAAMIAAGSLGVFEFRQRAIGVFELIQVFEAAVNDLVIVGAAFFFLLTLETRIKRRRALDALHELRSLAHIIDMHQLTKDPATLLHAGPRTKSSPERTMTPFELSRYLDYCNEMLSLCGKIASLYVQQFPDPVAIQAVNEIESLTTGLSRKIWQKIVLAREQA